MAYKLELPGDARIHPVFHASLLKQIVGADVIIQSQLPSVSKTNGEMIPNTQAVLDRRLQKGREGILIHWHGLSPADATWEDLDFVKNQFPE